MRRVGILFCFFVCFCFLAFYQGLKLLENFGGMGMELQLLCSFFSSCKKNKCSIIIYCFTAGRYLIILLLYANTFVPCHFIIRFQVYVHILGSKLHFTQWKLLLSRQVQNCTVNFASSVLIQLCSLLCIIIC